MTNAFGVVLDSAGMRRAAAEGVPETVIAAIYLLHERSVAECLFYRRRASPRFYTAKVINGKPYLAQGGGWVE